ncbi:MAG: hypothetical protein ABH840_00270 [Nanoarchaeota archaeon]
MNKKAQIWVETVIYTLIGLSIIGIVLGIVKPAIDERRDSISIAQSIDLLNYIDQQIDEVKYAGAGTSIPLGINIGRGKLYLDGENDKISIIIEGSRSKYSEPGEVVSVGGNIKALTIKKTSTYVVNLSIDYSNRANITYKGKDVLQTLQNAPVAYEFYLKNNGLTGDYQNVDFY